MGPAIRCERITKRFGSFAALNDLSFAVEEGTVTAFLGLNGAGKTTLMRILAGLSSPSGGGAWIAGQPVQRSDASTKSLVGFLPEEPAFPGWMTATQAITFVAGLVGIPTDRRNSKAAELLDQVGLSSAAKRKVAGFSRGMRQRLGLAQALVNDPPVLLLDEPSSALDPAGRRDVLDLIARLRGERTIFLSTHILSDVERICDSVVVIHGGVALAQSSVADLRNRLAVSSLEIEIDGDVGGLTGELAHAGYVDRYELDGSDLRNKIVVWPSDVEEAAVSIPALLNRASGVLLRYEWVTPDLEAAFLHLVGDTAGSEGAEDGRGGL